MNLDYEPKWIETKIFKNYEIKVIESVNDELIKMKFLTFLN